MTNRYLIALLALAGCTGASGGLTSDISLTGATIGDDGYATILQVPPAPYPGTVPAEPERGEDMIDKFARENGITREAAANGINGPAGFHTDIAALQARLRANELGNYVDMVMVRDPGVAMEVYFKRDAKATLAKYTDNPRFRAVQGGKSMAELNAITDIWYPRFAKAGLQFGAGASAAKGTIDVDLGVTKAEFNALAKREGWTLPEPMRFNYAPPQAEPAVAPDLEPFVRIFARSSQARGAVPALASWGQIVLDDGCFRMGANKLGGGSSAKVGALVIFGRDTQLVRDEEGYLYAKDQHGRGARIGEEMQLGWAPLIEDEREDLKPLRAACGDGPVVEVGTPESARSFKIRPGAVANYAQERKMTRQAAWDEIVACWRRQDELRANRPASGQTPPELFLDCDNPMHVMRGTPVPPPPVEDPADCPDGTKLYHGLCRDKDLRYVPSKSEAERGG